MQECTLNGERQCDVESPCDYHDERPKFWTASIFETNRQFGGPEEGGWWYDVGDPAFDPDLAIHTRVFKDAEAAYSYANKDLEAVCAPRNKGRYSPGSMACTGWYTPIVQRGYPESFPQERPHYE